MERAADVAGLLAADLKARRRRRRIAASVVAAVAAAGGGLLVHARINAGASGPQYVTAEVTRGALQLVVTATGTLRARNTVDVGAEVTGRLVEVSVDFNDHVEPGQVLARIDPVPFELEVAQAKARLASARAAVENAAAAGAQAARARDRAEALAAEGLLSKQDLDVARATALRGAADVAAARARVAEAEAALLSAQTRLAKTTIRSPIAGVVLDRKVEVGQTVTAGFQTPVLFSLAADLAEMELEASIDEADVGRVSEGQEATFKVDAWPDRTFSSKVVSIRNVPTVTQNVVTYRAVLSADNADRVLRPGMTATATIVATRVTDAVLVPNAAFRFRPAEAAASDGPQAGGGRRTHGLPFLMGPPRMGGGQRPSRAADPTVGVVWTVGADGLVPHRVRKGDSDGERTAVLEGDVTPGMRVVTGIAVPEAE